MKLPAAITDLFAKKKEVLEPYVSLYLDAFEVAGSVWTISPDGSPQIIATGSESFTQDTWETRLQATDRLLATLEDRMGTENITKVIFGLPHVFLTEAGDIKKDIRAEIKKLTHVLELEPVGFVPVAQSLIYKLKKEEGVPPSIILLGVSGNTLTVSVYKVGSLVGARSLVKGGNTMLGIEDALKSFPNVEVLPARILLYGSDDLETLKGDLIKHPWPSKVNFLHFPKIEIAKDTELLTSISLAGASEMVGKTVMPSGGSLEEEATGSAYPVPPVEDGKSLEEAIREENVDKGLESNIVSPEAAASVPEEEAEIVLPEKKDVIEQEVEEAEAVIEEDLGEPHIQSEDANVKEVAPEDLGFQKNVDILEKPAERVKPKHEYLEEEEEEAPSPLRFTMPSIPLASIFAALPLRGAVPVIAGGILLIALIAGILYWALPHATVTIFEMPETLDQSLDLTIDPTSTVVDPENKIIPGKSQEQSVSGDKTVPVTGKKNIGDPAKGTVTIYNKALSAKTYKKGTVIQANSLTFTLDDDVSIASASESIGSITFEKKDVTVTATKIGPQSNLAAGTEFTIKDVSTSVAAGRNDKALAGGTSKEVTVVTRQDYDDFTEEISAELIEKAKEQLATSVGSGEKLVDATIKTSVTEKVFQQELDQEATQLSGKVTISVNGISYNEGDILEIAKTLLAPSLPSGYTIEDGKTEIVVSNVKVQKNGKITASATIKTVALPSIDTAAVKKALAGKHIKKAEEYLRTIPGIAGVEFGFRFAPTKNRLPLNGNNISISISLQE